MEDLLQMLRTSLQQGIHLILLIDDNSTMKNSDLQAKLQELDMQEACLSWHGNNGPATFRRNKNRTPIDGTWLSKGLSPKFSGYLDYDSLIPGAEHRCLWTDITFIQAFGHNTPPTVRSPMRGLHCKDPRIVENHVKKYEKLAHQHELPKRVALLLSVAKAPLSPELIREYEA